MTKYKNSVLIVCPVAIAGDAKHLGGLWGESIADLEYISGEGNYQDVAKNKFVVRHTVATDAILDRMVVAKGGTVKDAIGQDKVVKPFDRPKFDVADEDGNYKINIPKAQIALSKMVEFTGFTVVDSVVQPYTLPLDKITYAVNQDPHTALRELGLVRVQKADV